MTRSPEANAPARKERKKPGRIPTACAECRRLKLRCDRNLKVPCENCLKRGCGAICPNGSLTTAKGNRLVLANTEELHNKLEIMSARIRELEDALRTAHAELHDELHPLLTETASIVSQIPKEEGSPGSFSSTKSAIDPVIDAFGTLAIGTRGETTFMSSTARPEFLFQPSMNETSCPSTGNNQISRLPRRIVDAWHIESDSEPADEELRKLVMSHRPPFSEAVRLCEIYLDWSKLLGPLSRHELLDEILESVYRADSYELIPDPHALSLLFSIFALASLFDFNRPPYNIEACDYYMLSRASLDFQSPSKTTTLHTVQAILNNVRFLDFCDLQMDPTRTFVSLGLCVKLAYKIGLHLHGARFQLDESQVRKRSEIFWQIFTLDTCVSFGAGRPPSVSRDWIDVPYPEDELAVRNEKGELEPSLHAWSWRWARLFHDILGAAFGADTPNYKTILDLDKKIRDFPVPPNLQLDFEKEKYGSKRDHASIHPPFEGLLVVTAKEFTLLNIHRRYFMQALQESPNDPLKHKYGPSVMAMYRCAWRLIVGHSSFVDMMPDLMARMSLLWSHFVSAAIVMCMIVTKAPNSKLAAPSLHELDVVYDVFKKSAPTTKIASLLLDSITKIWRKGHESIDYPHVDGALSHAELDRVGGGSTSLISNSSSNAPSPATSQASSSDASPHAIQDHSSNLGSPSDSTSQSIHPRIMQDMQTFNDFQTPFPSIDVSDYTPPAQFSYSLVDTQFDPTFAMSLDTYSAHMDMPTFYPAQPKPFHPYAMPNGGVFQPDGMLHDPAWQSFVEQLGF